MKQSSALPRLLATAFALGLLVANAACSEANDPPGPSPAGTGGGEADAGDGVGAWDPFFVLIAFTRATPVPRTPAEQVAGSTVVAKGFLDDVMEGRVIDYAVGEPNPVQTAVFRIRIEDELKGPEQPYAYAEFVRGDIPVDRMAELLPRDVPMVFLLREPTWDSATYRFEHEGRRLPEGATLHTFVYPSGIAVEGEQGIDYPLADEPFEPIFDSNDLDALVAELTSIIASQSR